MSQVLNAEVCEENAETSSKEKLLQVVKTSWKDNVKETWMTEEVKGMTKNQQKKVLKKKLFEERRLVKRKEERQRRKDKRNQMREAGETLPKRFRSKNMKYIQYSDYKVVVDLDFYDLMEYNDHRMVMKQVKHCYAANRIAKSPFQLYITSFGDKYKALFDNLQSGHVNWKMNMESRSYFDIFKKDELVYLTADSDNILETLDENKVYVIGGLVDHNQQKGLCLELAQEKGIAHAQLPIGSYVKLNTRKVLTINHVLEILLHYKESKDWKESFYAVIPKRKGLDDLDTDDTKDPYDDRMPESSPATNNQVINDIENKSDCS